MASKYFWKSELQYQQIVELLKHYWLTEKDEECVRVVMRFRHKSGRKVEEVIDWFNPLMYPEKYEPRGAVNAIDLLQMDFDKEFFDVYNKELKQEDKT